MRAVVLGYHSMGCVGFDALLRHGFEVKAVLTHADDPKEEVFWESLADRATARGIPVQYPVRMTDPEVSSYVASFSPDFLFSFYFRSMIPQEVLATAGRGALNLHGSLLPRYRGRAPVNWVLVHGERETGVSLHHMTARPDAGDLVDQERVEIAQLDTAFTLYRKLETAAARLLDRALPLLRDGTAGRTPLELESGSYFGGRTPDDGRIDWAWPMIRVHNMVRAVTHPYPGAFTTYRARRLRVWWALPVECDRPAPAGTVLAIDREGWTVACGTGALRLVTVQWEGQPELPASALAHLAGTVPGEVLSSEGGLR